MGFSWQWLLLLQSTGSRCTGFSSCSMLALVVVAQGLSCPTARGIFPGQGSKPCPLHWQGKSLPLDHRRSFPLAFTSRYLGGSPSWCRIPGLREPAVGLRPLTPWGTLPEPAQCRQAGRFVFSPITCCLCTFIHQAEQRINNQLPSRIF